MNKQTKIENKIKYYRRLNNLTQEQLAEQLGVTREVILTLENGAKRGKRKFYNKETINKIVDILEMRDKFGKSESYIRFLVEDGEQQMKDYRIKNNLTKRKFALMMKVHPKTITKWENGKNTISIENYLRYKKIRDSQ